MGNRASEDMLYDEIDNGPVQSVSSSSCAIDEFYQVKVLHTKTHIILISDVKTIDFIKNNLYSDSLDDNHGFLTFHLVDKITITNKDNKDIKLINTGDRNAGSFRLIFKSHNPVEIQVPAFNQWIRLDKEFIVIWKPTTIEISIKV